MLYNIRGGVIEHLPDDVVQFRDEVDLNERVNQLLNGSLGTLFRRFQTARAQDDCYATTEIDAALRQLPGNHLIVQEIISQAGRTLEGILRMNPSDLRLHYKERGSRIENSFWVALVSRADSLFLKYLGVANYLMDNPILTNDQPPKDEMIMWTLSGLANYYQKYPNELREFAKYAEEKRGITPLSISIQAATGDMSAIDKYVRMFTDVGGQEDFVYNGVARRLLWDTFALAILVTDLRDRGKRSKEEIKEYVGTAVKSVQVPALQRNLSGILAETLNGYLS